MLNFEEEKRSELQKFYGNRQMAKYNDGGNIDDAIAGSTARQDRRTARQDMRANETAGEKADRKGGQNALMGAGLGAASSVVSELDKTPDKYDGADVAGSALKYASMGAAAGPVGAAVGAAVGLGVGLVQKGRAEKAEEKADRLEAAEEDLESTSMAKGERSAMFAKGGVIDPYKPNDTISQTKEPWYGDNDFLDGVSSKMNSYIANGERTLNNTQVGLTALGMAPAYGNIADGVNTAISAGRAGYAYATGDKEGVKTHSSNTALNAAMMIPVTGQGLALAKLGLSGAKYAKNVKGATKIFQAADNVKDSVNIAMAADTVVSGSGVSSQLAANTKNAKNPYSFVTGNKFKNGGETKGSYSHSKNPLTVVDKKGKPVGMELTGGEGVFDKPAMNRIKKMAMTGDYAKLGQYVEKEMNTWKHK